MTNQKPLPLYDLPFEILSKEILEKSDWRLITKLLSLDKKHHQQLISDAMNPFWENVFKTYFPDRYSQTKTKISTSHKTWYSKVKKTRKTDYRFCWDKRSRQLIDLVKENNLDAIKAANITYIELSATYIADSNPIIRRTMLNWAQYINNREVLDYFYSIAVEKFKKADGTIDVTEKDDCGRTILYWALQCHKPVDFIVALLAQGSKLSETYFEQGVTPLQIAAQQGLTDVARKMIVDDPLLLNKRDKDGSTALTFAVQNNQLEMTRLLIEAKADFNMNKTGQKKSFEDSYEPALSIATQKGFNEIAFLLIENRDSLYLSKNLPSQLVHIAAKHGNLAILKYLYEKDPSIIEKVDHQGCTPLLLAAQYGQRSILNFLISKKANINYRTDCKDIDAKTPFAAAYCNDDGKSVVALLNAGVVTDKTTIALLSDVIHAYKTNILKALIDNDKSLLNTRIKFGETLLQSLVRFQIDNSEMSDYLIEQGADLNLVSEDKQSLFYHKTVLQYAMEKNKHGIVRKLLLAGAKTTAETVFAYFRDNQFNEEGIKFLYRLNPAFMNYHDSKGYTLAIYAAKKEDTKLLDTLKELGANLFEPACNTISDNGMTPLHWACTASTTDVLEKLISYGALEQLKPVTEGGYELHPIHVAAANTKQALDKLLQHDPTLLNLQDYVGQTPLVWAAASGRTQIVELLIEKGADLNIPTMAPFDDPNNGKTAIQWAAEKGYLSIVFKLFSAGAKTAFTNSVDQLIHYVVKGDAVYLTELLIKANSACRHAKDKNGLSAIHIAAKKDFREMVTMLLRQDKHLLFMKDSTGMTPLMHALASDKNILMVELLVEQGALKNGEGAKALAYADKLGKKKAIKLFLSAGVIPNAPLKTKIQPMTDHSTYTTSHTLLPAPRVEAAPPEKKQKEHKHLLKGLINKVRGHH